MKHLCKYCGFELNINLNAELAICSNCGHRLLLIADKNEKNLRRMERGDFFWRRQEFDKANSVYQDLLNENPNDAAVLWSLFLNSNGVGTTVSNNKEKTVIYRLLFTPLKAQGGYYQKAEAAASISQKTIIDAEFSSIGEAYKDALSASRQQPPYDVYITCRPKGFSGKESMENAMAVKLYDKLTEMGYTVFFPEITCKNLSRAEREPYIFAATNMSKVMLVLGSKPEAFEDTWVKSAYTRFLDIINRGAKKHIIPCYMNINAFELPDNLFTFNAIDFSKARALENITREVTAFATPSQEPIVKKKEKTSEKAAEEAVENAIERSDEETIDKIRDSAQKDKVIEIEDNSTSKKEEMKAVAVSQTDFSKLRYLDYSIKELNIGDYVNFGSYAQNDETGRDKELIPWEVIGKIESEYLLISKYVLDCKPFNAPVSAILDFFSAAKKGTDWAESDLKQWLNTEFYDTAFSIQDKALIQTKNRYIHSKSVSSDRVFCLSLSEIESFLKGLEDRKAKVTPYAKAKGAYKNPRGYSWWWLRSPGDNPEYVAGVDAEGAVFTFGVDVSSGRYGVRPAVWIEL